MIRNFAVVGSGQATRERLTAALAAAPDMAVYRIGRGADPLPVSATFDPSDQPGCRSLLDWFERGAPSGAVLLVDDWGLCFEHDPELPGVVEWIAAFGPARGVQVVVTARRWADLPERLRRHLHGEATDFLALQGIEADLSDKHQRRDLKAAVGADDRGWPVYLHIAVGADGYAGTYLGPAALREQKLLAALLGLMVTHSSRDLNIGCLDPKNTGVFDGLSEAPHVSFSLNGDAPDEIIERFRIGLDGELNRRQELVHGAGGCRNFTDYRDKLDAGEHLEPLAALLICVDSAEVLIERHPRFKDTLDALTSAGRVMGIYLLYSGDAYPEQLRARIGEWPSGVPPFDLEEWAEVLPGALAGSGPPAHQIVLPPLHHMGELTLDMIRYGSVGVIDNVFEQRRDEFYLACSGERRFGVLVGAPGTGKSTALRMLAHALGPDLPGYQLLDGPGEPIDPQKKVVVTARTWAEIPEFMMEDLAFAVEFRLDDPSASRVNPHMAAQLPTHPGIGLFLNNRLAVRFAKP